MLVQIGSDGGPKWIENKIDPFSSCKFCRRHEVAVTGYENNLVHLTFKRHGSYVQTYSHVDALLTHVIVKITVF